MSQSVSSSRMLAACPQLHRQSSSCLYSLGAAAGSMWLSLDKTPQLGTLTAAHGEERKGGGGVSAQSVRQDREYKRIKATLMRWSHLKVGSAAGGMREASSIRGATQRLS